MDLVAEAKENIENLSPAEVAAELEKSGVVLVDLREQHELDAQGVIPGAIHAPRGMLEFHADPSTPITSRNLLLVPGRSFIAPREADRPSPARR